MNENPDGVPLEPNAEALRRLQLEEFLKILKDSQFQEEFIPPRDETPSRDPFADWVELAPEPDSSSGTK